MKIFKGHVFISEARHRDFEYGELSSWSGLGERLELGSNWILVELGLVNNSCLLTQTIHGRGWLLPEANLDFGNTIRIWTITGLTSSPDRIEICLKHLVFVVKLYCHKLNLGILDFSYDPGLLSGQIV